MAVDRKAAEDGLGELIAAYREAQRVIAAQIREALREGNIGSARARNSQYTQIVAYLDRLGFQTDPIARRLIENAWREGDHSILRVAAPEQLTYRFGVVNPDAMEEMQRALTTSLRDARATIGRQVFDVYRRAGLRSTALGLLGARGSRRAVSDDLVKRLQAQGVKAFVDRAGRSWDLRHYAKMVARTTTREAVTAAQLLRMGEQGIELARISISGNPCPLCAAWQGKLVSLTGDRRSFGGEEVVPLGDVPNGGPPFHPNCAHSWSPESILFAGV